MPKSLNRVFAEDVDEDDSQWMKLAVVTPLISVIMQKKLEQN